MTKPQSPLRSGITEPILTAIIVAVLCSLLFHGVELVNFSLDAEEQFLGRSGPLISNPLFYLVQLKWGTYLSSLLIMPETIFPVTSLSLFLFAYGTAFVMLVSMFKVRHWQSVIVAAPFYFGFPVLLYFIAYNNVSYAIGLGILAATGALYLSRQRSFLNFAAAALLLAFAISTYQSVLWFAVIIFLADLLARTWYGEDRVMVGLTKRSVWYACLFISGIVLYFTIGFALLKYFGLQVRHIDHYIRLEVSMASIISATRSSISELGSIYGGYAQSFLSQNVYYRILMLTLLSLAAWHLVILWRNGLRAAVIISLALFLAALAAPFLQHPVAAGFMPYRTLVGVPAAVAVVALFATETAPYWTRQWLLLPLSLLLIIEFSAINNLQYYGGQWRAERDKLIASQIVLRLQEIAPSETVYRIVVVGAPPSYSDPVVRPVKSSSLSLSPFLIAGISGDDNWIANYLSLFSAASFWPANQEQRERALTFAANMPIWPIPGSTAKLDDIFVIKFGEPTQAQLVTACQNRQSEFCSRVP